MVTGAYYGHYRLTNEMVSRGTKLFSYLLTHQGEHSYTDILGKSGNGRLDIFLSISQL